MAAEQVELGDLPPGESTRLHTALALSLLTGRSFRARAGRLSVESSTWLRAAQTLGGATIGGIDAPDQPLTFVPGKVQSGDFLLDAGAAGSVSRLFQLVAFPLALAGSASNLKLRGGTHLAGAPTLHDLTLVWAPVLEPLGFRFGLELERAGFAPDGGGEVTARILPAGPARPFTCTSRGTLLEAQVLSLLGGLPRPHSEAQGNRAVQRLRERGVLAELETLPLPTASSKGAVLMVFARFERARVSFSAVARTGEPAEQAGEEAAQAFGAFMAGGGAVDEQLSAQLLVPLAVGAAGLQGEAVRGRFTAARISAPLLEVAEVIQRFLDVRIAIRGAVGGMGEVIVAPRVVTDAAAE